MGQGICRWPSNGCIIVPFRHHRPITHAPLLPPSTHDRFMQYHNVTSTSIALGPKHMAQSARLHHMAGNNLPVYAFSQSIPPHDTPSLESIRPVAPALARLATTLPPAFDWVGQFLDPRWRQIPRRGLCVPHFRVDSSVSSIWLAQTLRIHYEDRSDDDQ